MKGETVRLDAGQGANSEPVFQTASTDSSRVFFTSAGGLFLKCSLPSAQETECTFAGKVAPYIPIEVTIGVEVQAGASSGQANVASVTGGGAPSVQVNRPLAFPEEATPFGVENYELTNEDEGGAPDTQAGSHPFQQTTTVTLNQTLNSQVGIGQPAALAKE